MLFTLFSINSTITAQLTIHDHEGNEYEYAKMADGRNWMLENMRAKTDRSGNALHYYWRDKSFNGVGYDNEDQAAFEVGFAYLREEVLGSAGQSAVRTYSARTQGICPNGWHIPEYVPGNTSAELDAIITAYGGLLGSWLTVANWENWRAAMRLTPTGYMFGKFTIDPDTKLYTIIKGSQLHLMTSGHLGKTNPALLMNISAGTDLWGGYEELNDAAAYCRCVENIQSTVEFSNFSAFGVDLTFSKALMKNYGFAETVTINNVTIPVDDICPRNFVIKDVQSGDTIPVTAVYKSTDYKNIQIEADLDETKNYQLIIVDSKLRESGVLYGGYTFNGGKPLYFPNVPNGLNTLNQLDIKFNVVGGELIVEQFGSNLDLKVYNMEGSILVSAKNIIGLSHINVSHLNKGIYLARLNDSKTNESIVRKFIIK